MRLAGSGTQRARVIVEGFRFAGHQHGLRKARLDRGSDPRDQAAAGGRRHHDIRRHPKRSHILGDLPPHRTLAGDHKRIVIGAHQRRAAFGSDVAGDGFAILAIAIIQDHFRAIGLGAIALGRRSIRRHHDGRAHVEDFCRRGHALGVVAGRVRDHAAAEPVLRDRRQLVERAAKLERSGPLQHFRFQKHSGSGAFVERR